MLPKPPKGYLERSKADTVLQHYIMASRFDGPEPLPKTADPSQVNAWIQKTLEAESPKSRHVAKCMRLMRFFDLRSHAELVTKWMQRRDSEPDEYNRAIVSLTILAEFGDDALAAKANEYYQHLAGKPSVDQRFEQMIDVYFYLSDKSDQKWIVDPLEKKMKVLEPNVENSVDTQVAYLKLKNYRDDRLPRILEAKARRHEILKIADAKRRRQEVVRLYLGLETYAHVDFRNWAVMILQRDCNATTPDELSAAFMLMLDAMMSTTAVEGLEEEDKKGCVTSCARAVEFYGGQLNEKQSEFVKKNHQDQADMLYWETESRPEADE
ncbi:MAG: hypothetical protein KF841_06110 [Phycisphaerae bacterium]|nr:hypothetical protein [Phycisphaerae bacterium]